MAEIPCLLLHILVVPFLKMVRTPSTVFNTLTSWPNMVSKVEKLLKEKSDQKRIEMKDKHWN